MKIFKSKKIAIVITLLAMLFFLVENSMEIPSKIKIIVNILLIIIVAIINILSHDKNIDEVNPSLVKIIRVISITAGIICFLGVFILKGLGII